MPWQGEPPAPLSQEVPAQAQAEAAPSEWAPQQLALRVPTTAPPLLPIGGSQSPCSTSSTCLPWRRCRRSRNPLHKGSGWCPSPPWAVPGFRQRSPYCFGCAGVLAGLLLPRREGGPAHASAVMASREKCCAALRSHGGRPAAGASRGAVSPSQERRLRPKVRERRCMLRVLLFNLMG